MARLTVEVEIPADVETVWADVEQLETHVEWMADAETIEFEGSRRKGDGTVMRVLTRVGPFTTEDIIRVTAWDPMKLIGVVHEGVVTGRGEFRLEPSVFGTRFVWDEELTFPWYLGGSLGMLAARPVLRWVWRRNLARLASRFEHREAQ